MSAGLVAEPLISNSALDKAENKNVAVGINALNYPSKKYQSLLKSYRSIGDLSFFFGKDADRIAHNILTWQLPSGGFGVHQVARYQEAWNGTEHRSVWHNRIDDGRDDLANFDDQCTISEIRFLAAVYASTRSASLKHDIQLALDRAIGFIFSAQHTQGSWPQVYPERKKDIYSNYATLNDNAMIRIMVLLADIKAGLTPFDHDIIASNRIAEIDKRLSQALNSILLAQIRNQDALTIWPAQYDPKTYLPMPARSYEYPGKSSRESVGVVAFLLNWPEQTPEIRKSIKGALDWYRANEKKGLVFDKKNGVVKPQASKSLWYRFYETNEDKPFFGDRDGLKKYNLSEVSVERRTGYTWGGDFASKLLRLTVD